MKYYVSSYSFDQMIKAGKIKQIDAIALAKDLGFDGIEFAGLLPDENETDEAFAKRVKAECDAQGMEIGAYATAADFLRCENSDIQKEIDRLKKEVDLAAILGVKKMRHDASYGAVTQVNSRVSFEGALPVMAKGCLEVTKYAETLGIRTMVENHGFFCQNSRDVEQLINRVNHPNFGALADMGNFFCADEDSAVAIARMIPYLFHVHAKDFHKKPANGVNPGCGWFLSRGGNYLRGAIIGNGDVPVLSCLRLLQRAGYDEAVTLEFEGMEDPMVGIRVGFENLKNMMAMV